MSKATPGEWCVIHVHEKPDTDYGGGHEEHFRILAEDGSDIVGAATSDAWVDSPGEQWPVITEANARLISAAPDLLKACEEALAMLEIYYVPNSDGSRPTMDRIKAALAKVEGK